MYSPQTKTFASAITLSAVLAVCQFVQAAPATRTSDDVLRVVPPQITLSPAQKVKARVIFTTAEQQVKQVLGHGQSPVVHATPQNPFAAVTNLSTAQKTKIAMIRHNLTTKSSVIKAQHGLSAETKLDQIANLVRASNKEMRDQLTPAQRGQLNKASMGQASTGPTATLTPDQLAKIKAIRQKSMSDFTAILTPAQRQQLAPPHTPSNKK